MEVSAMKPFYTAFIAAVFLSLFIHPPNASPAERNPKELIAVALRNWPPQYLTDKKNWQTCWVCR